jgi:hypothetical protein
LNFSILITYPNDPVIIWVGYQSQNTKHVYDKKIQKQDESFLKIMNSLRKFKPYNQHISDENFLTICS